MFLYLLRISFVRDIYLPLIKVRGDFKLAHFIQARSGNSPLCNFEKSVLHFL